MAHRAAIHPIIWAWEGVWLNRSGYSPKERRIYCSITKVPNSIPAVYNLDAIIAKVVSNWKLEQVLNWVVMLMLSRIEAVAVRGTAARAGI